MGINNGHVHFENNFELGEVDLVEFKSILIYFELQELKTGCCEGCIKLVFPAIKGIGNFVRWKIFKGNAVIEIGFGSGSVKDELAHCKAYVIVFGAVQVWLGSDIHCGSNGMVH